MAGEREKNAGPLPAAERAAGHLALLTGCACRVFDLRTKEFAGGGENFCREKCGGCAYRDTLLYGCYEADRWGGRYIFYCPAGGIFVANTIKSERFYADYALVSGPVIMGEPADFWDSGKTPAAGFADLPVMTTAQVNALSEVAAGLCANIGGEPGEQPDPQEIRNQVNNLLYELCGKAGEGPRPSPLEYEKELQKHIALGDKKQAQETLNNWLGYIYFQSGGDVAVIKARMMELIVLLSRASIEGGADVGQILGLNNRFLEEIRAMDRPDDMNVWLSRAMHRFISYTFDFSTVKHNDVIFKVISYIREHLGEKIALADVANQVYLSRSYLSRIFKEEMGCNLSHYINKMRVEKAKEYLLDNSVNIIDVAFLVGFEDQSYFAKVFKSLCGVSPGRYRELRGKV